MTERGEDLRLALEARQAVGIERERVRDDLERHVAVQPRVARPVNLAHAAGAERADDFVRANVCACSECHVAGANYRVDAKTTGRLLEAARFIFAAFAFFARFAATD